MTYAVPVVDLENVQLEAVRAGARELGAVQVVNHGVPAELEQIAAWRDGTPYVAELAENSAGR